ncbi:MAG TPA: hypothetical protein VNC50_14935, partial [Planctomycetia bacterium]|nr:hypothetical protein [Planctomycetia bacterium]
TYKGSDMYTYALQVRRGAQPSQIFPLAFAPGSTSDVRLLGDGLGSAGFGKLTMPADAIRGRVAYVSSIKDGKPLAETAALVSTLPRVLAAAPSTTRGSPRGRPQAVNLPAGIAGVLAERGQVASFTFAAKKDQWYRMEVLARRGFSPVDAELKLTDRDGKQIMINDDMQTLIGRPSKDSAIVWQAPRDVTCVLNLRDAMGRGGPNFTYHLEIEAAAPDFELSCDPQLLMVGPGSRVPLFVRSYPRFGFKAPIKLKVEGLPAGVTASEATIPVGHNDALVVLEAAADAKLDLSSLKVTGTASVAGKELVRRAAPLSEVYQAGRVASRMQTLAVTEKSDLQVETDVRRIQLRPGESTEIPVTIKRADKFKTGPVTLWSDWRFERKVFGSALPPEITMDAAKSQTRLNGSETRGKVTLVAANNATPGAKYRTAILAQVSIEFSVNVPFCTAPIEVEILPVAAAK